MTYDLKLGTWNLELGTNTTVNKKLPLTLLILSASLFLSSPTFAQKKRPPAPVEVATAVMMEIAPVIEVAGTVISRDDAQLAAEVLLRKVEW